MLGSTRRSSNPPGCRSPLRCARPPRPSRRRRDNARKRQEVGVTISVQREGVEVVASPRRGQRLDRREQIALIPSAEEKIPVRNLPQRVRSYFGIDLLPA